MSTATKEAKVGTNLLPEHVDFSGVNLPAAKSVSELAKVTKTINTNVEGNVRGVSSYFKEFRREAKNIRSKIDLYRAKGRTFNSELCHRILNIGEIKPITEGSDAYELNRMAKALSEGKKFKAWNGVWSSNRMQSVFFFVIETTPKK